jgi:hypothetical protein
MQWIPSERIQWDSPCYKCRSHFCDQTCKEDAPNVVHSSSDLENKRRDAAFADFIGGVAYEEDRGWSKEIWDAAWSARREWVGLTEDEIRSEIKYFRHSWYSEKPETLRLLVRVIEAKLRELNT